MVNSHLADRHLTLSWGRGGGGLVDWAADLGPCDPSSIPLGKKKKNKQKEARVAHIKNLKVN